MQTDGDHQREELDLQTLAEWRGKLLLGMNYLPDGDISSAMGSLRVVALGRADGVVPDHMLTTNIELSCLWLSPAGHIWIASTDGIVGTTAPVSWAPPGSGVEFIAEGPDPLSWSATRLPLIRGLPPNVSALWGARDDAVAAGTSDGHILHWDGDSWAVARVAPDRPDVGAIHGFGGTPETGLLAFGANGTFLRFDGTSWRSVVPPGRHVVDEHFFGLLGGAGRPLLVCSTLGSQGRLLEWRGDGLHELVRSRHRLMGIAGLGDRILMAADDDGVVELRGRQVVVIRDTFSAIGVVQGAERLYFLEPAPDFPGYVEYDPQKDDAPWWRVAY